MTRTSKNRVAFAFTYDGTTSNAVKLLARGLNSTQVANRLRVSTPKVAAIKANLTRGTYWPFAYMSGNRVVGNCRY